MPKQTDPLPEHWWQSTPLFKTLQLGFVVFGLTAFLWLDGASLLSGEHGLQVDSEDAIGVGALAVGARLAWAWLRS